jgi:pectin methylesterase-like acyl-CoA thioesterase
MYTATQAQDFWASGPQQTQGDNQRTIRAFVDLANSMLGDSQTVIGYDPSPYNPTGQFTIASPDGTFSVQGQPVSNAQPITASAAISPRLLIIGALAWLILRKK